MNHTGAILKAMLLSLLESNGFTLDKQGNTVSEGYAVATETFIKQSLMTTKVSSVSEAINTFLESDHELIGGWIDSEILWIEASKVFDTADEAHDYCVANNEIAYYDLAKGQEVRI
jgi:hypothetical protein